MIRIPRQDRLEERLQTQTTGTSPWLTFTALIAATLLATPALAVDGVIEINQTRALASGVTPSDTPGFPVTISREGSYRLTGNLYTNSRFITAIQITASGVTVDLNGFTIACAGDGIFIPDDCRPGLGQNGYGVDYDDAHSVVVTNGQIRGMGGGGVHLSTESRVTGMTVRDNGGDGIAMITGLIAGNTVLGNDGSGIYLSNSGVVTGNLVDRNGGGGSPWRSKHGYRQHGDAQFVIRDHSHRGRRLRR